MYDKKKNKLKSGDNDEIVNEFHFDLDEDCSYC